MARNVDSRLYNEIQKVVVESSRHGIGVIFGDECQHGVKGDHHVSALSPSVSLSLSLSLSLW